MTTQMRETEQKYEAEAGTVLPSAEELEELPQVATVSSPKAETLVAEYFDTDDLRLLKAGVTLRRRVGGADEGWHLKLPDGAAGDGKGPAGASSRREIRDAVITRAVARELGISAHLAGENAFSFGLLSERAHRDALEYQEQARSAWKQATRREARQWLSAHA